MYRRVRRLELLMAQLLGIHLDRALSPAVGDVHHGALDGHPGCQGLDLAQIHIRVKPDAALTGAPKTGMLAPGIR